jgi:hypothetical protein
MEMVGGKASWWPVRIHPLNTRFHVEGSRVISYLFFVAGLMVPNRYSEVNFNTSATVPITV